MSPKYHSYLAFIIALIFLLFGCDSNNKNSSFQNLVFSNSCKNACWMGIEPKVSTTDDTMEILENIYGSENVKVSSDDGSWFISWNTESANWQKSGAAFMSNNIVDYINVSFPENRVLVKDIIKEVGVPNFVGLVPSGAETKCAMAVLLYPHTGLVFFLNPIHKSVGVSDVQVVGGLRIDSPWLPDNSPWIYTIEVPWDGYREYCPEK